MDVSFGLVNVDDVIVFEAKLGDKNIGLLYGYSLARVDDRPPMFFVYSVEIYPEHQNKGYGSRFMQYVIAWAAENGFGESFLMTEKDNISACRIYEKVGMTHSKSDCDRLYVIEY